MKVWIKFVIVLITTQVLLARSVDTYASVNASVLAVSNMLELLYCVWHVLLWFELVRQLTALTTELPASVFTVILS